MFCHDDSYYTFNTLFLTVVNCIVVVVVVVVVVFYIDGF